MNRHLVFQYDILIMLGGLRGFALFCHEYFLVKSEPSFSGQGNGFLIYWITEIQFGQEGEFL